MTVTYSVPEFRYTAEVCAALPEQVDKLLDRAKKQRVRGEEWKPGERPMQLQTARFTGRVFIYHASHLYSDEIDELTAIFKKKNLTPHFRRTPPPVVTRTPSVSETPPQKPL